MFIRRLLIISKKSNKPEVEDSGKQLIILMGVR